MTAKSTSAKAGKHLIIVESPHKAETIGKFLGPDYLVLSSKGHIRDLPASRLGIDIENGFKPEYQISEASQKIVSSLKQAAKSASDILLASDPDREGEAIAWHLYEVLYPIAKTKPFYRIQYNEITPRAVRTALDNPGKINGARVDAQQARRLIDRIVGYKVSPFIWKNIKGGSSAGRVQSVALRLVCEREAQINAFTPVAYWVVGAMLQKGTQSPFFARLAKINGEKAEINTEDFATEVYEDLKKRKMVVESVTTKELSRHAMAPFITSSLQRAASSILGFTPSRTMAIAQKLYEGVDMGSSEGAVGLITYMRTDAPQVSKEAQEQALNYIRENYGETFVPSKPNFYKSGAKAQEAHEAIRPTDINKTPAMLAKVLDAQELKLYDLIWRRFVASQMASARLSQRTVLFDAEAANIGQGNKYTFSATTSDVVFPGFLKVMSLDIKKLLSMQDGKDSEEGDDEDEAIVALPELSSGEYLKTEEIKSTRKETKPPARYSEAMLIDTLEKNGIGRPSTYASIMDTIIKHNYVVRERKILIPTDLGKEVVDFLVKKLPKLFEVGFTANMESDLDKVESGSIIWTDLMGNFYEKFVEWMNESKDPPADSAKVDKILKVLEFVKIWIKAEKRGRNTYDDQKLFESIKGQFIQAKKPISKRQLSALAAMAWRYRAQIPNLEELLKTLELDSVIKAENPETPPETLEKLDILLNSPLSEKQQLFISSLKSQASSGRNLSVRQVSAIDQVFITQLPLMENKAELALKYGIEISSEEREKDTESPRLLEILSKVSKWREPTKRGKRVFDDSEFYKSVKAQFEQKGALSAKQIAALKKLAAHYSQSE